MESVTDSYKICIHVGFEYHGGTRPLYNTLVSILFNNN